MAEYLSRLICPKYKFSDFGRVLLEDRTSLMVYERFHGRVHHHGYDRFWTLWNLAKIALTLEGDLAECGIYKGASAWAICDQLRNSTKNFHAFDSFSGLSEPGDFDGHHWKAGTFNVGEMTARRNLAEFPFVQFYPGWIPNRFAGLENKRFCFVHLDLDLYQPTFDSLQFFYPQMVPNGLFVLDDFGFATCPGVRKAATEFFSQTGEPIVELATGQAIVFVRAPLPT